MKLWTFQSISRWETLQRNGVLRTAKESEGCHLDDWFVDQMVNRIGPAPAENLSPIWGWHRCRRTAGPDRVQHSWSATWQDREFVRLEIEVPRAQVLLSDFDRWENLDFFHGFVPGANWGRLYELEDDLEAAGFISEILLEGIEIGRLVELEKTLNTPRLEMNQICRALKHPDIGPHVRKSWETIFDVNYRNGRLRHVWLQATFWELRLDHVVGACHFAGRSCRRIKKW